MTEKRNDRFRRFAFVAFMGALLWIGYDLVAAQMTRRQISTGLNDSLSLQKNGYPFQAVRRATELHRQWLEGQGTAAWFYLEKIQPLAVDLDDTLARLHLELALECAERQAPRHAEKHFTLALFHDPELDGAAKPLMTECFVTKNFELGWAAGRMLGAEGRANPALVRFFEENYEGPRDGDEAEP